MSTTNGNFTKINRVKVLDELVVSKATIGENRRRVINHVFTGNGESLTLSPKLHDNSIIMAYSSAVNDHIYLPASTVDMAGFSCDIICANRVGSLGIMSLGSGTAVGQMVNYSASTSLSLPAGTFGVNVDASSLTAERDAHINVWCDGNRYHFFAKASGPNSLTTL
jgi:hypothetical protein